MSTTPTPTPTLLSALAKARHLKYESFRDGYRSEAAKLAPGDGPPSRAQFFRWMAGQLKGGTPYPDACRVLEAMFPPYTAADLFGPYDADLHVVVDDPGPAGPGGSLLDAVPPAFPAAAVAGLWVTTYRFLHHGETARHHADIAHVTALSGRLVRAGNDIPAPRSEGRASPFRNEITAQLAGRHLVGTWRNTSDTRYFGAIQLAVLPGETVMDGFFTGVGSDVDVSTGGWRWVRLDPGGAAEPSLDAVTLTEPARIYDLVMGRSPYDPPLTLTDVTETPR